MIGGAPGGRIVGLNAWRAILMIIGILLHAGLWQPHTALFAFMDLCSGSFRMGCFFAISGMLSGFSLRQRSVAAWMRRRLVQIGLPTLFGLGVICPLITLMLKRMPPDRLLGPPVWLDWYHCWFLVGLLLYAGLAALLEAADRRWALILDLDTRIAASRVPLQLPVLLWIGVVVFTLMSVASVLVAAVVPADHLRSAEQVRVIVGYVPIYVFGFLLARAPAFARHMLASRWQPVLLLLLVALVYLRQFYVLPLIGGGGAPLTDYLIRLCGLAVSPAAASILILRSALSIRRVPVVLDRLCDASFTLYLVHLPLVAALSTLIGPPVWNPHAAFAVIAAATGVLGYAFHVGVVRRWDAVSLVLNGRRPTDLAPILQPASAVEASLA